MVEKDTALDNVLIFAHPGKCADRSWHEANLECGAMWGG